MWRLLFSLFFSFWCVISSAQVDQNFYIYICVGQSNMEGYARIASANINEVDERFLVLNTADNSERNIGEWYIAYPPIVRPGAGVGILDYFGPAMIKRLPSEVKVGVVPVAFGAGAPISCFDKDTAPLSNNPTVNTYFGGNAYARLTDMSRIALGCGVVKGILFHQGEANRGDTTWPEKVKKLYIDILGDLSLKADEVPLILGEVVNQDVGGACSEHNPIINSVPDIVPTAHVVSSTECPCMDDNTHFSVDGYKMIGERFAQEAFRLLGLPSSINSQLRGSQRTTLIYTLGGQQIPGDYMSNRNGIYIVDGRLMIKK